MSTPYNRLQAYLDQVAARPDIARAMAFGDSWFQYPLRRYGDLETKLSRHYGRRLLVLDDSYPGRDAKEAFALLPRWSGVARDLAERDTPFDLFLVSMGGNDIIGQDFAHHLKHADDPPDGQSWPWHPAIPPVVQRHIRLDALKHAFAKVQAFYEGLVLLRDTHAPQATILTHTYGDVTPMDVPYTFIGFTSGPWLWKPMRDFGLVDADDQRALSRWLLESFFRMLTFVAKSTRAFVVLDTRGELTDPAGWDNEIHPKGPGFQHLVDRFWVPAVDAVLAGAGTANRAAVRSTGAKTRGATRPVAKKSVAKKAIVKKAAAKKATPRSGAGAQRRRTRARPR